MKNDEIKKLIYKELNETPVGANWSEAHLRSLLSTIATNHLESKT